MTEIVSNRVARGRNVFSWQQFDALPDLVRQVINYAPVTLGTRRACLGLSAGRTVEDVARREIEVARWSIRRLTAIDYGPTHPQFWKDGA